MHFHPLRLSTTAGPAQALSQPGVESVFSVLLKCMGGCVPGHRTSQLAGALHHDPPSVDHGLQETSTTPGSIFVSSCDPPGKAVALVL